LRVLPAERTLRDLWAAAVLGSDPSSSVLALDFDQTLTFVRPTGAGGIREKKLRGAEEARGALHAMADAGVRMCIVTAQSPSASTVQNAARECKELGIAELFGVQDADVASVYAALESGSSGGDEGSLGALATRLLVLLLLKTNRTAADLVRVGLSPTTLKGDGSLGYRTWSEQNGTWNAEQRLERDDARPALCPVRAWQAYAAATDSIRSGCVHAPDRLLLSPSKVELGVASVATPAEVVELASAAMRAAGLSARDVTWLTEPPAKEITTEAGIKLAMMGHVIASKYNKPEGLQAWLQREHLTPTRIAFVDDSSDNAFTMFMHFAGLEREYVTAHGEPPHPGEASPIPPTQQSTTGEGELLGSPSAPPPVCVSVWYPPEASEREENHDAATREMLVALSRGPL